MLSIQNPSDPPCSSEISARNKRKDERTSDQLSLCEADLPTSTHNQLELGHFSIRDYVCRARKKDIRQNWPFAHPYLQVCLDHGVKDVLPPFEPPDTVHRWYSNREQALVDVHGGKAIESLHEESVDGRPLFLACIDQVEVADSIGHQEERRKTHKEKPSSVVSPAEAQQEGVDTESTITSDTPVGERSFPPKKCRHLPPGRNNGDQPPVVVKSRRSAPSSAKGQARKQVLEEEDCSAKAAPRGEDQSSVTGGKEECSESKPGYGRSEGFCSNLSTLVDPMASKLCPVCREFSSTSNTTLNAHIDQCLALVSTNQIMDGIKSKKNKVKPRKIRTMVDVYATARRCTLEELDRVNGTTWALNTAMGVVPVDGENQKMSKKLQPSDANCADGSDSGAVYIDSSGTKVRILSQLSAESGNLSSRKPSMSDSVERSPLTCGMRSHISNNSKMSRLRPQNKKLSTSAIPGDQISSSSRETSHTCGGNNKRKHVLLQENAQGKTRSSGPLKQWISLKCTGASRKKIMNDRQHNPTEDNILQDGVFSIADGSKSITAGLMEDFVPSPSESAVTHHDSANDAMNMEKCLEKKCHKKLYPTSGKKKLSVGKSFFSKGSDLSKRMYRFRSTRKVVPADHQEMNSSTETGERLDGACDLDKGCSRTCDPSLPSFSQAAEGSSLRCWRDSFETESNMLVDDVGLSKSSELDSVGKSDSTGMAMEEEFVAPKSYADHGCLTDEPVVVDLGARNKADNQEPVTGEIIPNVETSLPYPDVVPAGITSSLASRVPQTICVEHLLLDVNSRCLDSGAQVQLEAKISGLTEEESSFNIHAMDKEVRSSQTTGNDINVECNQYIREVPAFVSRVNTSRLQSEGSTCLSGERMYVDALLEKTNIGCSSPMMHSYPKVVASQDQHNMLDRYPPQMSPGSTRSSISVPTATRPLLSPGSFHMHSELLEKVNLRPSYCCSEPVRKGRGHLIEIYQPAPPNSILEGQATDSALSLEVSKGFRDSQHCHCNKGSCRGSFSICPSDLSCSTVSCEMGPPGCIISRNELDEGMSADVSNFTPQYSSRWQLPISGKVANGHVKPETFVPKNLQADITLPRGSCNFPPAESDHCHVQPSPSSVLRLMGKDLMVANNEVDPTKLPKTSCDSTVVHSNSKYLTLLGFPGAYNANLCQASSNHICCDATLVCDHKEMQYASSRFSETHGDFSNFGVCQPPQQFNSCCNIQSNGSSRFNYSSALGPNVQNEKLFKNCVPSGSFDAKKLGIARKHHKEVLAPFGAKSSQEIIVIDDSPDPCRTSSVIGESVQHEFQENRLSREVVLYPVLPNPSCNGVKASSYFPFIHDLADRESSVGAQRRFFTSFPGAGISSVVNQGNTHGSRMYGKNHFVLRSVAAAQLNPALCHSQRS